jgi:hypothetical protein
VWFGLGSATALSPIPALVTAVIGGIVGAALGGFTSVFQPGDADLTSPIDPRSLLRGDRARALTGSVLGAVIRSRSFKTRGFRGATPHQRKR